VGAALRRHLGALSGLGPEALQDDRYDRFRGLGAVTEPPPLAMPLLEGAVEPPSA
jgi:hypothetical protein